MDDLTTDVEVRGMTPKEIRARIYKRLQLNNINDLSNERDAFKFKKLTDGIELDMHYEVRGPIYGNLEFVATFEHQVMIPNR